MIRYDRFFALLKARGIKQTDLRDKGVHPRTFQKLLKGELIRSDTINQLCKLLECQPGDIMEYVDDGARAQ
ncbi:MAG: helix-turn-helix domain-containing protein [Oscillospiraceae bacterium]